MISNLSVFSTSNNSAGIEAENIFGANNVQKIVKDEMAFAPTPDSYQYLVDAAERFHAGKSVFFATAEEAERVLAEAKHA